jgi:hypothetical protein
MPSNGKYSRFRVSSSTSTILDSVGDELAGVQTTQSIEIKSDTKNENSIQQSTVMIGSTINVPQETAEVTVHNHYYNSPSQTISESSSG